jgi:hypothetical protein
MIGADYAPIANLSGLRGANNLTAIWMRNTHLDNLAAVEDLPKLSRLFVENCRLTSLAGLRGAKLQILQCDNNQIRSLGPLTGQPIYKLSVAANRIESLNPIAKLKLSYLDVSGNPVANFSRMATTPPKAFYCASKSLTDAQLSQLTEAASATDHPEEMLHQLNNIRLLQAGDIAAIRASGRGAGRRATFVVPYPQTYAESQATAAALGARLAEPPTLRAFAKIVDIQKQFGMPVMRIGFRDEAGTLTGKDGTPLDFKPPMSIASSWPTQNEGTIINPQGRVLWKPDGNRYPFIIEWVD